MSWDQGEANEAPLAQEATPVEAAPAVETQAVEAPVDNTEASQQEAAVEAGKEPKQVSQDSVNKAFKAIREKYKSKEGDYDKRIKELEQKLEAARQEGQATKEDVWADEPAVDEALIQQKVREHFLAMEDKKGHRKYGENYTYALQLISQHSHPSTVEFIKGEAPDPVESVMAEAMRIAEDIEYGRDPVDKMRAKAQAKQQQAVSQTKQAKAGAVLNKNNQPTNVSDLRAASGSRTAPKKPVGWGDLPG